MSGERLDPELQRELADQPQAQMVELVPGLTALAPADADPDEVRAEFFGV